MKYGKSKLKASDDDDDELERWKMMERREKRRSFLGCILANRSFDLGFRSFQLIGFMGCSGGKNGG